MALWILWYLRCYDVMRLSAASHRRGWKETLSSFSSLPPRMRMPSSGFPPRVKPLKGRKSTGIPRGPTTEIKHTNQSASTTSEGLLAPPFPVPSTAQHRSSEPSPPNHLPFPPSRQLVAFLAYQREMIGSRLLGSVALGGGRGNSGKSRLFAQPSKSLGRTLTTLLHRKGTLHRHVWTILSTIANKPTLRNANSLTDFQRHSRSI